MLVRSVVSSFFFVFSLVTVHGVPFSCLSSQRRQLFRSIGDSTEKYGRSNGRLFMELPFQIGGTTSQRHRFISNATVSIGREIRTKIFYRRIEPENKEKVKKVHWHSTT